jgi:hypothetical protein
VSKYGILVTDGQNECTNVKEYAPLVNDPRILTVLQHYSTKTLFSENFGKSDAKKNIGDFKFI